jgi:hypothetical protein
MATECRFGPARLNMPVGPVVRSEWQKPAYRTNVLIATYMHYARAVQGGE